jgi:hypothetical protein
MICFHFTNRYRFEILNVLSVRFVSKENHSQKFQFEIIKDYIEKRFFNVLIS